MPEQPGTGAEHLSTNALERRVKRWLVRAPFECHVQVTPGLEETLVAELLTGGFVARRDELRVVHGGVELGMDHVGIMRANLTLRTASRVLLRLGTFPAATPEMLYDRARQVPWETQIGFVANYALHVTSKNSKLQAGDAVANTVASAVSRQLRPLGLYPKPEGGAELAFYVRLLDDRCTISLDTSGSHLHRRGVRRHVHTAPVRETLAAAMVLEGLARMDGPPDVVLDPFCGSGTLLIEAADALGGLAPGRHRTFAFEHAAWFRPGSWREVKRGAEAGVRPLEARLLGTDIDEGALAAARANLEGDYPAVALQRADSSSLNLEGLNARRGLVLTNPPYGVRLGDRRGAAETTRAFLANLASVGGDWQVVILVQDPAPVLEFLSNVRVTHTRNGGLTVAMVSGRSGGEGITSS